MSGTTPFADNEVSLFEDVDFERRKICYREFLNCGLPMNGRHEQWLREKGTWAEAASSKHYELSRQACDSMFPHPPLTDNSYQHSNADLQEASAPTYEHPSNCQERPQSIHLTQLRSSHCGIQVFSLRDGWNNGLFATLDTGTEENWISPKIVERLNLEIRNGMPMSYTAFDGRILTSTSTVQATWCIQGQTQTHATEFRVAPKNPPFEVLIGRNLLGSGEVDFYSQIRPILIGVRRYKNDKKTGIEEVADALLEEQRKQEREAAEERRQKEQAENAVKKRQDEEARKRNR